MVEFIENLNLETYINKIHIIKFAVLNFNLNQFHLQYYTWAAHPSFPPSSTYVDTITRRQTFLIIPNCKFYITAEASWSSLTFLSFSTFYTFLCSSKIPQTYPKHFKTFNWSLESSSCVSVINSALQVSLFTKLELATWKTTFR